MRPYSLIEEAARYVADYEPDFEFTRWTERNWFDAFRYALSMVVMFRPGEFTDTHEMKLRPGSRQMLPADCDQMLSVVDPIREMDRKSVGLTRGRPVCESDSDRYEARAYAYDREDPRAFYVYPPVPEGADATITVTCSSTPWPHNMDEDVVISNRYRGVLLDFMLWYAFGFDTESVPSRNRAEAHFKAATDALGVYRDERNKRWSMNRQEEKEGG